MRKSPIISLLFCAVLLLLQENSVWGNPFSDLPSGHWAYDAVVQLSSQGLLHGYPDKTFQGGQPVTRYEMASILARALKGIDLQYATREQEELVRRVSLEFREELKVLGVVVEQLEDRSGALQESLGGWRIGGSMRLDANFLGEDREGISENNTRLSRARLDISRRFGEGEQSFFYAQMDAYPGNEEIFLSRFYTRFNLPWNVRMTVGRFSMDLETDRMAYTTGAMGYYGQGAWFTDLPSDGIGFSKEFALGYFDMYAAKRSLGGGDDNAWNVAARLAMSFNQHFDMDIGLDFERMDEGTSVLDSLATVWVAPKLEITQDIGLRGAVYAQFADYNDESDDPDDNPIAWRVILEVKQSLLKFTSLWLEYNNLGRNFILTGGISSLLLADQDYRNFFESSNLGGDLSIWRIGLNQEWSDQWASWIYYARYNFSDYPAVGGGTVDPRMEEISMGFEYRLNKHITMSLGYFYHKFNEDAGLEKNRILRFRTSVWF